MNTRHILLVVLLAFLTAGLGAAPVTNADIEKLLVAGMSEGVILNVINGGERQFDVSPDALIALKAKGATPAVLAAMTAPATPPPTPPPTTPPPAASLNLPPGMAAAVAHAGAKSRGVLIVDHDSREEMSYNVATTRFVSRLFGLGGFANYLVIQNQHAERRTANHDPWFVILVPKDEQAGTQATLTVWAIRSNGTREIATYTGSMYHSSNGFPDERIIPLDYVKAEEQPTTDDGFVRYELHPKKKLGPGEYALVLGQGMGAVYDFGVDGSSP